MKRGQKVIVHHVAAVVGARAEVMVGAVAAVVVVAVAAAETDSQTRIIANLRASRASLAGNPLFSRANLNLTL
jgi:hypothetical protein